MKVRDVMNRQVIRIHPEESVEVAARMLEHYNIGVLPVCGFDGTLCGVVTDRDLVTRCLAPGKSPRTMRVEEVMTRQLIVAEPDMDTVTVADRMGKWQIRRLPVLKQGRLCGMVSLGDLASREETVPDAVDALTNIAVPVSIR